jgi:sigma-B regulation protein RsbU (phosphoserine phosphatase)
MTAWDGPEGATAVRGTRATWVTDFEAELFDLQALTDTALARLGLDELLIELLDRVREVLDADTAAMLLIDAKSGELEARAARGIEAEVRQGVRVPLGMGFAGRVASTRVPRFLERVDATTVANPILWETGLKVMLGVPVVSGDEVIGVLHVGRLADRPFVARDAEVLGAVAERAASAIRARQFNSEQEAAYLLERSLLPGRLPIWPGLELAARYVSAESRSVGGDWYDLFELPSGQRWMVIGDIAGHGLNAAVVMGRIRSALRAYSLLDVSPEQVLELVDRKMHHFEIGTVATVAIAVTEPSFDRVRIATAGHLPPVLVTPETPAELLPSTHEPLLGAGYTGPRTSTGIPFPPGAVMVMYTDGLVERRNESLDAGLERLRTVVACESPHLVCGTVMRTLIGQRAPADDIALVVVRRAVD